MKNKKLILLISSFAYLLISLALNNARAIAETPASEFKARREQVMKRLPDGILLIHSRSIIKGEDQSGFRQDPSFYYFTGLENTLSAILAIDGTAGESRLFLPARLSGLAVMMQHRQPKPNSATASQLMIEHVVGWDEFASYIDRRISANPNLIIYTDTGGFFVQGESNPPGLAPIENPYLLWQRAIESRWPKITVRSASDIINELRSTKSATEIEAMRRVGKASARALLAGLGALKPDISQREVEAEVVRECLRSGGEGPSFWPWVMTGSNAVFPTPFISFADYRLLNRIMRAGELARVDVGCALDHYEGDVGRTAPVSGRFDPGQRETWELLVRAYRAGLAVIKDGVRAEDVIAASLREVERQRASMKTSLGKKATAELLSKTGAQFWQLHGVGLESAEPGPKVLRAGMVIAFEPIFSVEGQGFYLEDMILITSDGYEILTRGLPYSADEIERAVVRNRTRRAR